MRNGESRECEKEGSNARREGGQEEKGGGKGK